LMEPAGTRAAWASKQCTSMWDIVVFVHPSRHDVGRPSRRSTVPREQIPGRNSLRAGPTVLAPIIQDPCPTNLQRSCCDLPVLHEIPYSGHRRSLFRECVLIRRKLPTPGRDFDIPGSQPELAGTTTRTLFRESRAGGDRPAVPRDLKNGLFRLPRTLSQPATRIFIPRIPVRPTGPPPPPGSAGLTRPRLRTYRAAGTRVLA